MLATLSDDLNLDKIADIEDKVHDNNALANHNLYSQEKLCLIKMEDKLSELTSNPGTS